MICGKLKFRMAEQNQTEQRYERRIERLRKEKKDFYREMVARGEEVTCMIRVFLMVKDVLPEGARDRIEKIARQYAERNDADRGSVYCPGEIDFRDDGILLKNKTVEERVNDRTHKVEI